MRRTGIIARTLAYWGSLTLVAAAVTHLVTILVLPGHSPDDAYARLARLAKGETLATIPGPAAAAGPLRGQDPAFASAFCLYDLRKGPIQVDLDVTGADVAMLAVYSRRGQVLYGLTNRSAAQDRLTLTIAKTDQAAAAAKGDVAAAHDKVRVETGDADGIVLAQALAAAPSARAEAEAVVSRLVCGPTAGRPVAALQATVPRATN